MIFVILLSLAADTLYARTSPYKRFLANCPPFNAMCICPKYQNGCYTCPSSCSSEGSTLFGNFHPGEHPGAFPASTLPGDGASAVNAQTTAQASQNLGGLGPNTSAPANPPATSPSTRGGSSSSQLVCPHLDSNCPQFMIKVDANDCLYCSGLGGPQIHNMDPANQLNKCPPKDPNIPWSSCHIDRQGCILCEGQIVTTQSTTTTPSATTSTTPSTTTKSTTTSTIKSLTTTTSISLSTAPITTPSSKSRTQSTTTYGAMWSAWYSGPCSVTCGRGNQIQIRRCSTGSDSDCPGSPFRIVPCDLTNCPGYWLPYRNVTACSVTCGDGYIQQRRQCSTGKASDCQGRDYDEVPCRVRDC